MNKYCERQSNLYVLSVCVGKTVECMKISIYFVVVVAVVQNREQHNSLFEQPTATIFPEIHTKNAVITV